MSDLSVMSDTQIASRTDRQLKEIILALGGYEMTPRIPKPTKPTLFPDPRTVERRPA